MKPKQGEIYWANLGEEEGSVPALRRPVLVLQNNLFNKSAIQTVIICIITSNLSLADVPGTVFLPKGLASLPKNSLANLSQITTINKIDLEEKMGILPTKYMEKIIDALKTVVWPT